MVFYKQVMAHIALSQWQWDKVTDHNDEKIHETRGTKHDMTSLT